MLAVAWNLLGNNSAAASPHWFCSSSRFILFVVSLLRPVWKKQLQGKLLQSKLVCHSSSLSRLTLSLDDTVVSRGESERKAQTANQLVAMSPVAKKRSVDQPVRTERTESITDWANNVGAIRFHQFWIQRHYGKTQRFLDTIELCHLLIAVCGYYDTFSK